jgi:hypothetical protein
LREALKKQVRTVIGPVATPDEVRFTEALPKTRSGKIMRRLLKQVAAIRQEPQRPVVTQTQIQSLSDEIERLQRQLAQGVRSGPSGTNDKKAPAADERSGAGDSGLLALAQAQWSQGDWKSLASMQEAQIQQHPDRAMLAMLAAAGLFQLDEPKEARHFAQRALQWGCDQLLLQQVMVAGIKTSVGKALGILETKPTAAAQSH